MKWPEVLRKPALIANLYYVVGVPLIGRDTQLELWTTEKVAAKLLPESLSYLGLPQLDGLLSFPSASQ